MAEDIILEARRMWWEIVESDEGECRQMGIVRELADEVERLRLAIERWSTARKEMMAGTAEQRPWTSESITKLHLAEAALAAALRKD